ncbi:MAG: hydrogenase formation protein HypD [Prevotella sp.]|jgi:hydrogenase expression/formation protein HypD|nr:hydrogenase formation protein HypD [Prevotella sp.]
MKYIDEYRDKEQVKVLVDAIQKIVTRSWHIMEICGGQTHAISRYRIEELLPQNITLLHGPGCPVCVTPMPIIDHALEIAKRPEVIFASFGDMMRVPGTSEDLLTVKARGADVRMLYSSLDAVELAEKNPDKEIVFFAVGFETTIPVHLTAVKEAERRRLNNFSLITSLFAVPPAIDAILSDAESKVDGFLTAGHVCAIMGNQEYYDLAKRYHRPMVVTGFEPLDLLYGIYRCVLQLESGKADVENAYKRVVLEDGNPMIRRLMNEMLEPFDQQWRGIGQIAGSGLQLRKKYEKYDAVKKFPLKNDVKVSLNKLNRLSLHCIAGEIMKGNKQVSDCPYFGTTCKPETPVGAPMVSTEGVCAAYYNYK